MKPTEIKAFFTDESSLNVDDYIFLTYWLETDIDPVQAVAYLCSESSTAQWCRPGVDEDFRPLHAAKVVELKVLETSKVPSFPSQFNDADLFHRCFVRIAHPLHNCGVKIPNLLTIACGEGAFFSHGISSIKLLDIDFPKAFFEEFKGPRFGLNGLRRMLDVHDRPFFFGVVKPNIGLNPEDFSELAYQAWVGGLDAAKDDEMLADTIWSPFSKRMELLGIKKREAEDKTGVPKMFVANITDEVENLVTLHDIAVENGINAVMVNGMTTGFSAIKMLKKRSSVPIVAHFDFIAAASRIPFYGVASEVFTKLQRLVGFDAIIMPGFGRRMLTPENEVISNVKLCTQSWGGIESALPLPGGSDWAGTLPMIYDKVGSVDFGMVPGRGVFGHPQGPKAGAKSLHQAWRAVKEGTELKEFSKNHAELANAIKAFG
ncbi:MAG: RuBisCO large subunit C-terminal-like domain-containing protein [Pseudomonadota bacterium]